MLPSQVNYKKGLKRSVWGCAAVGAASLIHKGELADIAYCRFTLEEYRRRVLQYMQNSYEYHTRMLRRRGGGGGLCEGRLYG